jgi:DNA polymerase-1
VPLCNFVARIVEEAVLDDGVQTTREWVIEGRLSNGDELPIVRVPVQRFPSMSWVSEQWGVRAIVYAGQATRDYLREAIQHFSPKAVQHRVYIHNGWREIAGAWVYLTASGALGRNDIEVDLGPDLARYQLPYQVENPVAAMQASLRLLHVAPMTVTVPLWAATYRAPLASILPIDLSIFLEGMTGALKSSLVAVFLSHYGTFDHLNLPGTWSATANFLERRAFTLKDTVFVVDDFAPKAGLDDRELYNKAARLLRAQGNLSGRGRLNADLSERRAMPPRGLIVATGEQHPIGQSILARIFLVAIKQTDVNRQGLGRAQTTAGLLSEAMAGYLHWQAPRMPDLQSMLPAIFADVRRQATQDQEHLRVPAAIAHLWIGLDQGLTYAQAIGACSEERADSLRERGWAALCAVGGAQGRLVEEERPTLHFLRAVATLITQGRVYLLPKEGGWGGSSAQGAVFVGWHDDEFVYLLPDAAFEAVARSSRDAGHPFPIRQERLRRELTEERLSDSDSDRLLKTVKIGGKNHRTLCLWRSRIDQTLGEEFPVVPSVPTSNQ